MIRPENFYNTLKVHGIDFYTGVPDSLLKDLCAFLTDNSTPKNNIIAANEGGAIGLAAGHYLATGKIPVVYMQNSGLGNTVNPLLSLTDKDVYNIPVLLVIGWRGEPGVHDEPQHVKQGKVTISLLDTMGIKNEIMCSDEDDLNLQIERAVDYMKTTGEAFALVVKKGTFEKYNLQRKEKDLSSLEREDAIKTVASALDDKSIIVSTTGKISRELFEYRESLGQGHTKDFLTVGSMGHASQIALGIALEKPDLKVFCFDGDGAVIMHTGSMGIIGSMKPDNFYHVVFNNGAHDSVGGQPTIGGLIDLSSIAKGFGYKTVVVVDNKKDLENTLADLPSLSTPLLLEIKVKKGARDNLGRPTTTPVQNKEGLMSELI